MSGALAMRAEQTPTRPAPAGAVIDIEERRHDVSLTTNLAVDICLAKLPHIRCLGDKLPGAV